MTLALKGQQCKQLVPYEGFQGPGKGKNIVLRVPMYLYMYGQCTSGMTPESAVSLWKSIKSVGWTKLYMGANGKNVRDFTSTMR